MATKPSHQFTGFPSTVAKGFFDVDGDAAVAYTSTQRLTSLSMTIGLNTSSCVRPTNQHKTRGTGPHSPNPIAPQAHLRPLDLAWRNSEANLHLFAADNRQLIRVAVEKRPNISDR